MHIVCSFYIFLWLILLKTFFDMEINCYKIIYSELGVIEHGFIQVGPVFMCTFTFHIHILNSYTYINIHVLLM